MEVGGGGWREGGQQGSVIFEHLLTLSEVFYPAFTYPARGRLEGGGRGEGEEDVDVIYEHSLTPLQVFHPILSFSVPFIDSFISENNHYLGD